MNLTAPGVCSQYDGKDCNSCVSNSKGKCAYCNEEKLCHPVLSKGLFSESKLCKGGLSDISWGTCSVNMLALIIGVSVVGGLLLISFCACICCCCCCKNSAKQKLKWMKQDAAAARKTEERKAKYAERRAERQVKNDEIRKKYGLFKGDQGSYQRMEEDDA
ncbi:hypothetical protein EB796_022832 [Bugula neritina]|uniref:PTTG1IP n=1 Tax=Bugula neritina TaxID=10212 RepID=A0A7J7J089_BUGNE|nr:hypothetical protein EB796_022832 [Bugula neritina]